MLRSQEVVKQISSLLPEISIPVKSGLIVPTGAEVSALIGMPHNYLYRFGDPHHPGGALGDIVCKTTGRDYLGRGLVFGEKSDEPLVDAPRPMPPAIHETLTSMTLTELTTLGRCIREEIIRRAPQ